MTKAEEERLRRQFYRSIPKKDYVEMSGRAVKILNEQADRYKLPLRGRTVDLGAVLRSFHDFLAANARSLSPKLRAKALPGDDEFLLAQAGAAGGEKSEALERWRSAKADMAELQFKEMEGRLVDVDQVRQMQAIIARNYKAGAETIQKHYGVEACRIIEDCIDAAEREVLASLGKPGGDGDDE